MTRANRQLKILDIISKHDIDTQEELVAKLRSEGFNITQATISRDIKDMGIIKTLASDGRHYKYAVQRTKDANASDKYLNMFKNTSGTEWNYLIAGLTLTLIPIFIIYILAQKYITSGMMSGAVKS